MWKTIVAGLALLITSDFGFAQNRYSANPFPQIEDTVKVYRFAGNWKVKLSGIPDQDDYETYITVTAPIEHYCEPLSGLTCRYKIRHDGTRQMSAAYVGAGNIFNEKFLVGAQSVQIDHAPGIVGHWGAESNLNFGNGSATGIWKYGDKRGAETWTRVLPTINRVEFTAVDAGSEGASLETDSPIVTGTADDDYYGWGAGNRAPGTRPRFFVRIFGDNLWGFHLFDVKEGDGLQTSNCFPINGETAAQNHGVIGLQCSVLLWPGVENGRKILRLDHLEIPFRLSVDGLNEENKDLKLLVANSVLPEPIGPAGHVPGRPSTNPLDTTLFAKIKNYGEKTAPALQVTLDAEEDTHGYSLEYCDPSGYDCSPCDSQSDERKFLCPSANLNPNQLAMLRVNVEPQSARKTSAGSDYCPPPANLKLDVRGYDNQVMTEPDQSDNSADFQYRLKQSQLDYIELHAKDVSKDFDDESFESSLYPLEVLYPYGAFVAQLHLTGPVCHISELDDIEFSVEIIDGATGRRELRRLTGSLNEGDDIFISEVLGETTNAPGTVFNFFAQDKSARAVVEPIASGVLRLTALDQELDRQRKVYPLGGVQLDYQSRDADVRNVSQIDLTGHIFQGDIEDKPVGALVTRAGKEFEYSTFDMIVENVDGQTFSSLHFVPPIPAKDLQENGASIAVDATGHVVAGPGLDRLQIFDGTLPEIAALTYKQGAGAATDVLEIGEPFQLEARLARPAPDHTSLISNLMVISEDPGRGNEFQNTVRELKISADDPLVYRADMIVEPYTDGERAYLQGMERESLIAQIQQTSASANLVLGERAQTFIVRTTNALGQDVNARGKMSEQLGDNSTITFVTNQAQIIKNKASKAFDMLVEFPGCCIYQSDVTIPKEGNVSKSVPPLSRVTAQSELLSPEEMVDATLVSRRDALLSAKAMQDWSWRMSPESGNFQSAKNAHGLDIPPGSYEFWLVHSNGALRLKEQTSIGSGVTNLVFNEESVTVLSPVAAVGILQRGTTKYDELDEAGDFDGDGIPNQLDTKPREYSDILFHEDSTITARVIKRGGNLVKFTGFSGSSYAIEVIPDSDNPTEPAVVEVLGVSLELKPGTILEVAFG